MGSTMIWRLHISATASMMRPMLTAVATQPTCCKQTQRLLNFTADCLHNTTCLVAVLHNCHPPGVRSCHMHVPKQPLHCCWPDPVLVAAAAAAAVIPLPHAVACSNATRRLCCSFQRAHQAGAVQAQ